MQQTKDDDHSIFSDASLLSSSDDESSTTSDDLNDTTDAPSQISSKEVFNVWSIMLPIIVCFFIFTTSILGFSFVSGKRHYDHYEKNFDLVVAQIQEKIQWRADAVHDSFSLLSEKITAHAITSRSTWPLVTLPNFEIHSQHIKNMSNSEFFALSPIVTSDNRKDWQKYVFKNEWMLGNDYRDYSSIKGGNNVNPSSNSKNSEYTRIHGVKSPIDIHNKSLYAPVWQMFPLPSSGLLDLINFDVLSVPEFIELHRIMELNKASVVSKAILSDSVYMGDLSAQGQEFYDRLGSRLGVSEKQLSLPHSIMVFPIFDYPSARYNYSSPPQNIVGFLQVVIPWEKFLSTFCIDGVSLYLVLRNECGQTFTFLSENCHATYLGRGDRHEQLYRLPSGLVHDVLSSEKSHYPTTGCRYSLQIYPTAKDSEYVRYKETLRVFAPLLGFSYALIISFFYMYHRCILRRTGKVLETAERSNAVIESLFPSNVHERLFGSSAASDVSSINSSRHSHASLGGGSARGEAVSNRLKNYLKEGDVDLHETDGNFDEKPIADLFPNATVLFADIVGFTAWSSMRDPTQVFTLLEAVYGAYDSIAINRGVFKVETIGDCYVAVTGLPDPDPNHAVIMAQFAWECMFVMHELTKKLEATLGPDTGDLSMRFGLHSGPVTAGVLRGARSRFQLFGETVRTVAFLESSGQRGRVHLSQETAELIIAAGNSHWVKLRDDKVVFFGKGELTTYWLTMGGRIDFGENVDHSTSFRDVENFRDSYNIAGEGYSRKVALDRLAAEKQGRLVDFNVEILQLLMKQIVARRNASKKYLKPSFRGDPAKAPYRKSKDRTVLEEVKEVVHLPKFNAKAARMQEDPESIELGSHVKMQLRDYVATIASMYNSNPFHNFEHASHVAMGVVKLLTRIVAPTTDINICTSESSGDGRQLKAAFASKMHDHTFGITSDPLTQFAVVVSALIHDVDHSGVPNSQLVKENEELSKKYKGKSVAEQNSVDLAWDLLMRPCYVDLRNVICSNETEWTHFRQLVVNAVMATDIVDKELKDLRNARWDKAFSQYAKQQQHSHLDEDAAETDKNRKATIVIEHLIQASDVSHTMQHWHIYCKWNKKFFQEMYKAYKEGRAEKDPSTFWYKGEIGFFDFYIIPLAKKLKDCGVFGVSSDEYLNYALKNRDEWARKGQQVVAELVSEVHKLEGDNSNHRRNSVNYP